MIRLSLRETQQTLAHNVQLIALDDYEESCELLAAYLRRCASILCPCSSSELINAVSASLAPVTQDADFLKFKVADVLSLLIGYGDILEQAELYTVQTRSSRLLYLQKPSFIWLGTVALLVGVASDGARLLPVELEERVELSRHRRQIRQQPNEDLKEQLLAFGLMELDREYWRRISTEPFQIEPAQYVSKVRGLLKQHPGGLDGLIVIDGRRTPDYYRGRWVTPNPTLSGLYVGRRPQMFGNNLWCFVELSDGVASRMVDLPQLDTRAPGRNEAWRLQMALDSLHGTPQRVKVEYKDSTVVLTFFSPLPTWEQRRLENAGQPVSGPGLFSYEMDLDAAEEELRVLKSDLWLQIDD